MLLFGGSGLEAGGYLEPEVYSLIRTVRTEIEEFEKSQKSSIKEELSRSKSAYVLCCNAKSILHCHLLIYYWYSDLAFY